MRREVFSAFVIAVFVVLLLAVKVAYGGGGVI